MYRAARVYSAECPVERRNEVTDNKAAMFVFFFFLWCAAKTTSWDHRRSSLAETFN